jgi:Arc/MetJ-type ribon-helix-helix transcriptional regulator
MTKQVPVRLTDSDLAVLDELVESGGFASRSDVLRAGLERLAREKRERELVELYKKAYAEQPEEEWIGQTGAALLAALYEAEGEQPL